MHCYSHNHNIFFYIIFLLIPSAAFLWLLLQCAVVVDGATSIGRSLQRPNSLPCTAPTIRMGRVRYRQRSRLAKFLCNTGYTLVGNKYSTCTHGMWDNSPPKCVRPTCSKINPPANGLIYPAQGGAVLYFYCNSNYQMKGPAASYCDGRHWDAPLPTCLPTNTTPSMWCDFEEGDLCGWNHDVNHDFEWTRLNYETPSGSIGTGPSYDHTKGPGNDGFYMYIESSSRNENDTARLISPVFDKTTNPTCLEFYYHMYGATTGTLRAYVKYVDDEWRLNDSSSMTSAVKLFEKSGNQGDHWYRSYQQMGLLERDYQIIIEGVRGPGYVSDIAIDDVRIVVNCNRTDDNDNDKEQQQEMTTDSMTRPKSVESCDMRCNQHDLDDDIDNYVISCDCDEGCYERNRCCPDYYDLCVFNTAVTSSIFSSSSYSYSSSSESSTIDFSSSSSSSISSIISTDGGTNAVIRTRPTIVFVTPEQTPIIYKKTRPIPTTAAAPTTTQTPFERILIVPAASGGNENTTNLTGLMAGIVAVIVVVAVIGGGVWSWRRRTDYFTGLRRGRRGGGGYGGSDSQSDVRFLTGDEHLDLSLPRNYTDL